jgi:hypothetical protein
MIVKKGILRFFKVLYSTLLHLPPLRIQCVGGCWDRTQDMTVGALLKKKDKFRRIVYKDTCSMRNNLTSVLSLYIYVRRSLS